MLDIVTLLWHKTGTLRNCGCGAGHEGVIGPDARLGGGMTQELTIRTGSRRPVQKQRQSHGWTATRRERFLAFVAATCNVRAACEDVGLTQASAYALRQRDPAFRQAWKAALETGYDRLEGELLRGAIATLEGRGQDGEQDAVLVTGPVSVEQAIKLLDRHRVMLKTIDQPRGSQRQVATQAETDAMLLKRLSAIDRQREQKA